MKRATAVHAFYGTCWRNEVRRSGPLVLMRLSRSPAHPQVRFEILHILHHRIRCSILLLCASVLSLRKRGRMLLSWGMPCTKKTLLWRIALQHWMPRSYFWERTTLMSCSPCRILLPCIIAEENMPKPGASWKTSTSDVSKHYNPTTRLRTSPLKFFCVLSFELLTWDLSVHQFHLCAETGWCASWLCPIERHGPKPLSLRPWAWSFFYFPHFDERHFNCIILLFSFLSKTS